LGTPNNTYLKYNPKAKGNGVTIIITHNSSH
ncbi:hypothetical protein ACUODJ_51025, partial [Escherichia sp. HC-CC]